MFDGELFQRKLRDDIYTFDDIKKLYAPIMDVMPENYGIDKKHKALIYIPENAKMDIYKGDVWWEHQGRIHTFKLSPEKYYVYPSGHHLSLEKTSSGTASWRLVSTFPQGTSCHKPCTVSGGGKSEISKSLQNAIIYSPFTIDNFEKDFAKADEIIHYDYTQRWKKEYAQNDKRTFLDSSRTLGSAIKLLTPSVEYNDTYNDYLSKIPEHVKSLVLFVKRFYRPERHKQDWKEFFTVDVVNGRSGRELIFNGRKILGSYLRVGFSKDGSWLLHKLRTDFVASAKIQTEDDITASIIVPADKLKFLTPDNRFASLKMTENCEEKFFQRPDEAIHRGYDVDAERDLSLEGNFTSNYEPLTAKDAEDLIADAINFDKYTDPIKALIKKGAKNKDLYFISPSHTRVLNDGKRSTNPRYLQIRPDFVSPLQEYMADVCVRFARKMPWDEAVRLKGIRPLAVYNPIHYQELPELFMDFITSLTGKSPSTTGAGSEGALTKAPFNMLTPTSDLNNALLSYILTGYQGFSSAAGYIGKEYRFDHDVSLLIPEIWARIDPKERNAEHFIKEHALEKLEDFEYNGKKVLASRLGYRINATFCAKFMNTIFNEPQAVFNDKMLKPELQNMEEFVDGINNIVEAQQKIALNYFKDGSIDAAIPPLQVLLHMMAYGHYQDKDMADPELRKLFDRDEVIKSDWYKARLLRKQQIDIDRMQQFISYIEEYIQTPSNKESINQMDLPKRLELAKEQLSYYKSKQYVKDIAMVFAHNKNLRSLL